MKKRNFYNRSWKSNGNVLHISQDGYTDNELNIIVDGVSTMITKSSLDSFADALQKRHGNIYSCHSDYAPAGQYFKATKTEKGYEFFVKGLFERSIELPFEKVDKVIEFLKFNCSN